MNTLECIFVQTTAAHSMRTFFRVLISAVLLLCRSKQCNAFFSCCTEAINQWMLIVVFCCCFISLYVHSYNCVFRRFLLKRRTKWHVKCILNDQVMLVNIGGEQFLYRLYYKSNQLHISLFNKNTHVLIFERKMLLLYYL